MEIRDASVEDADKACDVLRRSIIELCGKDHNNDPGVLAAWLANKTPENVTAWIGDQGNRVLVAVEADTVLAVGAVKRTGEITLNYVSPDARFSGVSRALLKQLEAVARDFGNEVCSLVSTETARRFYLSAGYVENGAPQGRFGTASSYPMTKDLGLGNGDKATEPA